MKQFNQHTATSIITLDITLHKCLFEIYHTYGCTQLFVPETNTFHLCPCPMYILSIVLKTKYTNIVKANNC